MNLNKAAKIGYAEKSATDFDDLQDGRINAGDLEEGDVVILETSPHGPSGRDIDALGAVEITEVPRESTREYLRNGERPMADICFKDADGRTFVFNCDNGYINGHHGGLDRHSDIARGVRFTDPEAFEGREAFDVQEAYDTAAKVESGEYVDDDDDDDETPDREDTDSEFGESRLTGSSRCFNAELAELECVECGAWYSHPGDRWECCSTTCDGRLSRIDDDGRTLVTDGGIDTAADNTTNPEKPSDTELRARKIDSDWGAINAVDSLIARRLAQLLDKKGDGRLSANDRRRYNRLARFYRQLNKADDTLIPIRWYVDVGQTRPH